MKFIVGHKYQHKSDSDDLVTIQGISRRRITIKHPNGIMSSMPIDRFGRRYICVEKTDLVCYVATGELLDVPQEKLVKRKDPEVEISGTGDKLCVGNISIDLYGLAVAIDKGANDKELEYALESAMLMSSD